MHSYIYIHTYIIIYILLATRHFHQSALRDLATALQLIPTNAHLCCQVQEVRYIKASTTQISLSFPISLFPVPSQSLSLPYSVLFFVYLSACLSPSLPRLPTPKQLSFSQ